VGHKRDRITMRLRYESGAIATTSICLLTYDYRAE